MTREQMTQAIAERDMAHGVASRLAELVMGGCDYDEMAQRLTDTYAEWLGISEDDEEYDIISEVANEHMAEELAEVFWYEYCEEEATEEQLADVLTLAREIGVREAVWCVADAQ